ncbi:hypothetical protein [uncultured Parabacteroides sp.]|uniref:hypothetical protein n=1 Tax=uncultured Parabacteroides sp. TaxID=512312 RepID=UPI0025FE85F4|nr:hypothetical protein [uncultured Parabacteroides sp.]
MRPAGSASTRCRVSVGDQGSGLSPAGRACRRRATLCTVPGSTGDGGSGGSDGPGSGSSLLHAASTNDSSAMIAAAGNA